MKRIKEQGEACNELAKQILAWITYAACPLNVNGIQYALATRPDMVKFDNDFVPSIENMLSICAGLVTVDAGSKTVRLFHYTAQDYLMKTEDEWYPDPHPKLATICMRYIQLYNPYNHDNSWKYGPAYYFFDYAIKNWGYHARLSSSLNWEDVILFLEKEAVPRVDRLDLYNTKFTTRLHMAAYHGIEKAVLLLLDTYKHAIDARDSRNQTPLINAIIRENEAVVKLLIDRKADVNSEDINSNTPLLCAVDCNSAPIVKLLLADERIDPNQRCGYGHHKTALHFAIGYKFINIVQILLDDKRVDPHLGDASGNSPFRMAVSTRNEDIIELLLNRVGPDLEYDYVHRRLFHAARKGYADIVKLLLNDKRINPNLQNSNGESPLRIAVTRANTEVIRVLLASDRVNVNLKNSDGRSLLYSIILRRNTEVIKALLDSKRFDVSLQNDDGKSLLYLAVLCRNTEVKVLLSSKRVGINSQDENGYSALHIGTLRVCPENLKELLAVKGN